MITCGSQVISGSGGVSLSSTTPAALGSAAVGTGTTAARSDHVHALPTTTQLDTYRRVPTDASDLAVWTLDDASGTTVTNTGTASSANLTTTGTVTLGVAGIHSLSGLFGGGLAKGAAGVQPAAPLSVSAWVYVTAYPSSPTTYTRIVGRPVNGYSDPWYSVLLQLNSTGTLAAEVNSATATTGSGAATSTALLPLNSWHHVGLTYDGTTLLLYMDGLQIASVSRTRTIGYTGGASDVWSVGGNPATTESNVTGRIDDVRIATVVRAVAWWREVYARGVGYYTP